jgi:CHAT domain-containing protein/tetratricopeptide (TPR) repeat protein
MTRISALLIVLFLLFFGFAQNKEKQEDYSSDYLQADKLFHTADNLEAKTGNIAVKEKINRGALDILLKVIAAAEKTSDDSLLFHCYLKAGILYHYSDSPDAAKNFYLKAITRHSIKNQVPDSFYFKPQFLAGSIYYSLENFDSAQYHYTQADEILNSIKKPLQESEQLYRQLGALYFETGNYKQAKNYFEKALSIPGKPGKLNKELYVYYKNNIAISLLKLEEYDKADTIFQSILPFKIKTNEILNHIGFIHLEQGAANKALEYFNRIKDSSSGNIQVLNHSGRAYFNLKNFDSARYFYSLAEKENTKWNADKKNMLSGLTNKYMADLLNEEGNFSEAVNKYHIAVRQFAADFNEKDFYKNPESFSGIFSYIHLFNALTGKAAAFENWYQSDKNIKNLKAALSAYHTAFSLAGYIEKTYNSDEAGLFLNKIKYTAYNNPVLTAIRLHELTRDVKYLEDAYYFDQLNKTSVFSLTAGEASLRKNSLIDNNLLKQQSLYKTAITRLTLKTAQTADSLQSVKLKSSIRDYEIELGKTREKLNLIPALNSASLSDRIPSVDLVKKLLDEKTALLSYRLSDNQIVTGVITKKNFSFTVSPVNFLFYQTMDSLRKLLTIASETHRNQMTAVSAELYNYLIKPVQNKLSSINRLIIIPDDELHYLPFDVLMDAEEKYLVEKYAIQYLYSTALLGNKKNIFKDQTTLAFAPYIKNKYTDAAVSFDQLPGTEKEIENLSGTLFIDSAASKQKFIESVNRNSILHLATHAQVNNEKPMESYIAFYPKQNDSADFRLYVQEIYNLRLDNTDLVILSACETGTAQLIKGEGLMSLSRAFAYAGCPNIITSLWKASDQTTAIIISKLHYYLSRGFSADMALQKAKLDLLKNKNIDPRFKLPDYWAHLVSIGNYEPIKHGLYWRWVSAGIIIIMIIYYYAKRKKLSPYLRRY